jgi:tetratricopeptide (TPR) repeat protein
MPLAGQPPASPPLQQALQLLAEGKPAEANEVVTRAAKEAKGQFGSGSPPLARAYADMARLHVRAGDYKRAAAEFKHAADGPVPTDAPGRRDRLAFMFGYAACLEALAKPADAEKVYRQCAAFARNLHGPAAPGYAVALGPLADLLLTTGQTEEAARLADEGYDILWKHGDRAIAAAIPVRALALKAAGRADDPFADLTALPDDLVTETVAHVLARAGGTGGVWVRQVFADLLKVVERRFGADHPATADTLAAIARHEAALGEKGDPNLRAVAARRSVWAFLARRVPADLVTNLDVGFEPGGAIHLAPRLARDPSPSEAAHLEAVLVQAVDDLYDRPAKPPGA